MFENMEKLTRSFSKIKGKIGKLTKKRKNRNLKKYLNIY